MAFDLSQFPARLSTGAFILNSGIDKWSGDEETAKRVHGIAATAYPFLKSVEPPTFLKALAGAEIALGAALLVPAVPAAVAGAGLTGFAAGLLGLYARVPGMRRDKIRPSQQGNAIAKDVWLLGIGAGLLANGLRKRRSAG